jgi:hypothetical protein
MMQVEDLILAECPTLSDQEREFTRCYLDLEWSIKPRRLKREDVRRAVEVMRAAPAGFNQELADTFKQIRKRHEQVESFLRAELSVFQRPPGGRPRSRTLPKPATT